MNKIWEELDNLLNEYELLKIPNEVGSYDLIEDSEIFTTEEIKPEDSISNSREMIKRKDNILTSEELEKIYNIEGQIKILNPKLEIKRDNRKLE